MYPTGFKNISCSLKESEKTIFVFSKKMVEAEVRGQRKIFFFLSKIDSIDGNSFLHFCWLSIFWFDQTSCRPPNYANYFEESWNGPRLEPQGPAEKVSSKFDLCPNRRKVPRAFSQAQGGSINAQLIQMKGSLGPNFQSAHRR